MSRTRSRAATSSARPDRAALEAARTKHLRDVLAPRLDILFCGINPGLYSAATGHHFARPGNRFWPALHAAGFTPRQLHPSEESLLLQLGYGLTNLVSRASASAEELSPEEFVAGRRRLARKVRRWRPAAIAILGLGAFRHAFGDSKATVGLQRGKLEGAWVWVLPSPSGLNANHPMPALVREFCRLRRETEKRRAKS